MNGIYDFYKTKQSIISPSTTLIHGGYMFRQAFHTAVSQVLRTARLSGRTSAEAIVETAVQTVNRAKTAGTAALITASSMVRARPLTSILAVGSGASALHLAIQVVDYHRLRRDTESMPIVSDKRRSEMAESKEWIILGRQSPGYVRDSERTPKHSMVAKFQRKLDIPGLGAAIDNEKHYELLPGSEFQVTMMDGDSTAPNIIVPRDKMLGTNWKEIDDTAKFEVGFARKQGFADVTQKSPFYHSSIALKIVPEGSTPHPGSVVITGADLKRLIKETNDELCHKQHCDLYSSNCYSATTFMMAKLIIDIDAREGGTERGLKEMQHVAAALHRASFDNFSRGVSNNPLVSQEIREHVVPILAKHGLLTAAKEISQDHQEPPITMGPI